MTPSQKDLFNIVNTIKNGQKVTPGPSVNVQSKKASRNSGVSPGPNLGMRQNVSKQTIRKIQPNKKSCYENFDSLNMSLELTGGSIDGGNSLQSVLDLERLEDSLDAGNSIIQDETGAPKVNPKFRKTQVKKIVSHFFKQ